MVWQPVAVPGAQRARRGRASRLPNLRRTDEMEHVCVPARPAPIAKKELLKILLTSDWLAGCMPPSSWTHRGHNSVRTWTHLDEPETSNNAQFPERSQTLPILVWGMKRIQIPPGPPIKKTPTFGSLFYWLGLLVLGFGRRQSCGLPTAPTGTANCESLPKRGGFHNLCSGRRC